MNKYPLLVLTMACIFASNVYATEKNSNLPINVVEMREVSYSSPPDVTPNPTMEVKELENWKSFISENIYKSPYHNFELKIPSVAGSGQIRVIQSLISRRADGNPITSDVIFLPNDSFGASALIVTRIRDDSPKDSAYILAQFSPPNELEKLSAEKRGMSFKQYTTSFGTTLQRSIKNIRISKYFPFKVFVEPSTDLNSIGVSRFVVKDGYLLEFIVVADNRYVADPSKLQVYAESELDVLMDSMIKLPQLQ